MEEILEQYHILFQPQDTPHPDTGLALVEFSDHVWKSCDQGAIRCEDIDGGTLCRLQRNSVVNELDRFRGVV